MTYPNTRGTSLTPSDRAYVLAAYVHRFTAEHVPAWSREKREDGTPYPVQFASDTEWLENTFFATKKDGRLDRRNHACCSSPTWPNNPELRRPKSED